jgi:hypothetical protein
VPGYRDNALLMHDERGYSLLRQNCGEPQTICAPSAKALNNYDAQRVRFGSNPLAMIVVR